MPLVSVIVPVYNAEKTLERCLGSILAQSYAALEVLAVNDGSTDGSLELLEAIAARDGRVRVFTQPNLGVAAARNLAIGEAVGEYLQFADSDDQLPHDATARMVQAMQREGCQLVIAPYTEVVGNLRHKRGFLSEETVLGQHAFLDCFSLHPNSFFYAVLWNKLYRRDLIVDNGILCDGRLPWGEDFAFNADYYAHVRYVAVLSEPVYDYIRNASGLALSTSRRCLIHPIRAIRVKILIYRYYVRLFERTGLYERYRRVLPQYLFKVTINN